jgi:hypothetical protein
MWQSQAPGGATSFGGVIGKECSWSWQARRISDKMTFRRRDIKYNSRRRNRAISVATYRATHGQIIAGVAS